MVGREEAAEGEPALERRRHVRVETQLGVTYAIVGDGALPVGRAVTRDISHGGACLAVTGAPADLLEKLAGLPLLEITIDRAPAASFRARVEWLRFPAAAGAPALIGLEFRDLSPAEETVIIDLIAQARCAAREPHPGSAVRRQGLRAP